MREQPHYTTLLTKEFFMKHYVEDRKSFPQISEMLQSEGKNIAIGTIYKYAKKLGISRTISEACVNKDPDPLDWTISYMTEATLKALDGFVLGDGSIQSDKKPDSNSGRINCSLEYEEFARYMMSFFNGYKPIVVKINSSSMKQGFCWQGQSKFHPDFYKQRQRWYPIDGKKQVPEDVRITPISVLLWYLGDGSLVSVGHSVHIRLSTDGFLENGVEILVRKMNDAGIDCHRNNDNRIYIEARGIPAFFKFIGECPVECYKYKWDLPEWRFEAKRMKDVASELNVEYQRLSYLVKINKLQCYRASEKGRPRMLPEHIEQAKGLIKKGELY